MTLYEQVLTEVRQFLPPGENVERFVVRQCQHIQVNPEVLSAAHIPELAWWVRISAAILIPQERALILRQRIEALHCGTTIPAQRR